VVFHPFGGGSGTQTGSTPADVGQREFPLLTAHGDVIAVVEIGILTHIFQKILWGQIILEDLGESARIHGVGLQDQSFAEVIVAPPRKGGATLRIPGSARSRPVALNGS
jgi:hypothetical protein